jgi:hypothetical protein
VKISGVVVAESDNRLNRIAGDFFNAHGYIDNSKEEYTNESHTDIKSLTPFNVE